MNSSELDQINKRFDAVDIRFGDTNKRFDDLKDDMNSGFGRIEKKLDTMGGRITSLEDSRSNVYGIAKGMGMVVSAIVCLLGLFMYVG